MTQPLSPEEIGKLFQAIDNQPTEKLSELAKLAELDLAEDYIGADLSDEDLSGDNLTGINLSNANLSNTNLSHANLSGANLSEANLCDANLNSVSLTNANLSGANLSGVNLSNANLFCANLSSTNLSHANLSNANLGRANLLGAKNLTTANWLGTNLTEATLHGKHTGYRHLSDWALLNRVRRIQLERLSERDRHLVEVFHAVYRRDRLQQRSKGAKKCPDPSTVQLQEMLTRLQFANVTINTTVELMKELKQVAILLRQYDIWTDFTDSLDKLDVEQREFLEFLHQQLSLALAGAIKQEISDRISWLQRSRKYAIFAQQLIPGLQLYYSQGMSLKDIAPRLGMTSWDQARRVLNPGELLSKVRTLTVQQLLDSILKKALEKGLTKLPPESNYLKTLAEQIEAFADAEIFQQAAEEIRAGKNRRMNSAYAQQLRIYLELTTSPTKKEGGASSIKNQGHLTMSGVSEALPLVRMLTLSA